MKWFEQTELRDGRVAAGTRVPRRAVKWFEQTELRDGRVAAGTRVWQFEVRTEGTSRVLS